MLFRWKLLFQQKFLCSLIQCAHVLQHLKTVKRFHNRISINYRQVKDSSMGWDFFKYPWKMWILSQKFRWKFFFIKIFSGLHYNANTFWIIQRMWKVFIVVSQAVNDTSGSAHVIQHSLKLQNFHVLCVTQNMFTMSWRK